MNEHTRRDFLKICGALSVAATTASTLPATAWADPMGLPIGIQLYTVRGVIGKDTPGTLKQLYDIGYREVETAGYAKSTAAEFGKMIHAAGLKCPSAHLALDAPDLSEAFDLAHALGATYATSSALLLPTHPAPGAKTSGPWGMERFKKLAAQMNDIGKKAKAAGLRYAYHNHNIEFEKMPDGSYGYDLLLKETDPETVFFEIDCGWMTVAGASPVAYMKAHPKRFKMLHIKDFKPVPHPVISLSVAEGRPVGAELGAGFIDYKPIFAEGRKVGIEHVFAEQEGPYTKPEMESAKIDYDYLHSMR